MNLAIWEGELERLNYLSSNSKDLFLLLIQTVMGALLCLIAAFWLFVLKILMEEGLPARFFTLMAFVLLTLAAFFVGVGFWQANRLSDKRIDATKKSTPERIDELSKRLKPASERG